MTPEREARIRRTLGDFIALLGRGDEADPMTCAADLLAALDEARRERDDAMVRHAREQDEASAQRAALVADRDGWKDIAERRYALRSELEATLGIPHGPAESDSVEKAHARLRAILDERDSASAEAQALRAQWQSSLVSLRTGTLERERDAALAREARLREAAAEVVRQVLGDDLSWWTPERRHDAATMVTTKTLGLYDALADPTVATWLADRERAAEERGRVEALRTAPRCTNCGGCMSPKAAAGRRRDIEEAEERGARWGIEAAIEAAPESEYFVQWPNPAEVCRAARKEGTR